MNPLLLPLVCFPIFILLSSPFLTQKVDAADPPTIARPGCQAACGNVSIPFPFGVGAGCFHDPWFQIKCNASKKPFLPRFHSAQVIEITIPDYNNKWLPSVTVGLPSLNGCGARHTTLSGFDLRETPFNFSTGHNVFLMEGCAGGTILTDQTTNKVLAGCGTICHNKTHRRANDTNKCYGNGVECCQMQLPSETQCDDITCFFEHKNHYQSSALQFYEIGFYGQSSGECLTATLIKNDSVGQYIGKLSTSIRDPTIVPVLLYWSWVSNNLPDPYPNAECWRDESSNNITLCKCKTHSAGNPFLLNGCQRKAQCKHCSGYCTWKEEKFSYSCEEDDTARRIIILGFVVFAVTYIIVATTGTLLVVFVCRWLFRAIKRRRKTEQRVKTFKLKLRQHQSSNEGVAERTKLFTHKKLDKATDHFNENRILGRGGQGIVYKGMLIDGTIVAIKKSCKLTDESQMEQFINEVAILSTINHRNVVKLLGCCLETEVPLLVYEFISNGTLSQHIHHPSEDFFLTWAMRLKIAADSAGAIAYLHSSSSTPVYHRDIKPCNILLDDKYRAKVSDFGSSKSIEIDQTHLTTLVQGTLGYLDPEYFESGIFTDKSDVYSFGVVLLELLTSKKPIYRNETMEQKVLITEFFVHVQNSKLFDILDHGVVKEAKKEELIVVADLAKRCLNEGGRLRPSMKEVAVTLEMIIKSRAEMSTQDQQASPNEGFSEIFMSEMSDGDVMSGPFPTRVGSPMYIDVHLLLHDTV